MELMALKLHHFLFQSSPYSNWPQSVSTAQIEDFKTKAIIIRENLNMPLKEICCALCSQIRNSWIFSLSYTGKLNTLLVLQAPFCFCGTREVMLIQGESWECESQVDSSLKWSCTSLIGIKNKSKHKSMLISLQASKCVAWQRKRELVSVLVFSLQSWFETPLVLFHFSEATNKEKYVAYCQSHLHAF